MVTASRMPAVQLTSTPSVRIEKTASTAPKLKASSRVRRPRGMGRAAVRAMRASMSASYHMLSAPEAPAPMAIASSAMMASTGWMLPGATTIPVNAVNTTSDITRGFISCTKSPTLDSAGPMRPISVSTPVACISHLRPRARGLV